MGEEPESYYESGDDGYDEVRKEIADLQSRRIERSTAQAADIDRTLLSLSGGALVFSTTFVSVLSPERSGWLIVLFISWAAFALSILLVVLSKQAAQRQLRRNNEKMNEVIADLPALRAAARQSKTRVVINLSPIESFKSVVTLDTSALVAFFVGVILLGIFMGQTIWHIRESPKARRDLTPSETLETGEKTAGFRALG